MLRRYVFSCAGVEASPAPRTSAAAPAVAGVDELVPLKHFGAYEKLATHAAALRSGLILLSFVGPHEL